MRIQALIRRFLCRSKYDYKDLWIRFSEISIGSAEIHNLLPKIAKFIARAMSVRQVAFWIRSQSADNFEFVYALTSPPANGLVSGLWLDDVASNAGNMIFRIRKDSPPLPNCPIRNLEPVYDLGIERVLPIQRGNLVLGFLGVSGERDSKSSVQDDQFLLSVSSQVSHLILAHRLSQDLLIAKEWDAFNQCASFVLHDLKNLATVQSMILENAKDLREDLNFVADAFATFNHTTEQMIDLIVSLSFRRSQFSLKQPINILEVIRQTFDELKLDMRNGLSIRTKFPPMERVPPIRGDPNLLRKAFTNVILNAIQSLPSGEGKLDITVSQGDKNTITTSIRDTGCGIPPGRLESMFRPFQSSKENGLGIGLCHSRSIIEFHGGEIRIKSNLNNGTTVEIDLPASTPR